MDNYNQYIKLLGIRDQNLPVFKENRLSRFKSVQKMVELIEVATNLSPIVPDEAFVLNPYHPEWDDRMVYPTVDWKKYTYAGTIIGLNLLFYSYNYAIFSNNIRLKTFRYLFPFVNLFFFANAYSSYNNQMFKINLFDQYVWLRSKELAAQNQFIFQHPNFKRFIWFWQDFKETISRVHRQANQHKPSDFADSELMLQDFIRRYSNENDKLQFKQQFI